LALLAATGRAAFGKIDWEPAQQVPTAEDRSAWFPGMVVDHSGRVHLIWSDTAHAKRRDTLNTPRASRADHELLEYSIRAGGQWSPPRSIAVGQQDIYRHALAIDSNDMLHLLFRYCPGSGLDLYYRQAPAAEGFAEGNWQHPSIINFRWNTYSGDIAARGDTLHMVFDDVGTVERNCYVCSDIYYRRSTDGGATWSAPLSLRPSLEGGARERIAVDAAGVLHVTWDEGWDRNSGAGKPVSGVYMLSPDGGETWSEPTVIDWPKRNDALLTAASDGKGGVLLAWRTTGSADPGIYFQWSTDWGATWTEPDAIPGISARSWASPFDRYYATADGGGNIHLLASGILSGGNRPGLYDLEWNGRQWAPPIAVYEGERIPEFAQLLIDDSGGAHATWFARAAEFGENQPHQVWYAHGRLSGAPPPKPAPQPVLARALAPAATPVPLKEAPTPRGVELDRNRLLGMGASILVGMAITAVVDFIRRRRRVAA
jgi:hypothetical protein